MWLLSNKGRNHYKGIELHSGSKPVYSLRATKLLVVCRRNITCERKASSHDNLTKAVDPHHSSSLENGIISPCLLWSQNSKLKNHESYSREKLEVLISLHLIIYWHTYLDRQTANSVNQAQEHSNSTNMIALASYKLRERV